MSTENQDSLYWHGGKGTTLMHGIVCKRDGKSGRAVDPLKRGRLHIFPYNWPQTINPNNGLFGHVHTQHMQGPYGETVHHDKLDGSRVGFTLSTDGTPACHTFEPTDTGGEAQQGQVTYVSAKPKQGR